MMRIILLLLLTLTGPFCTFTQASPTMPPTSLETTSEPKDSETSLPVASTQTPVSETTEKIIVMTEGVTAASTDAQVTQTESAASTAAAAASTEAGTEEKNDTETTIGATTDVVVEPRVMNEIGNASEAPTDVDIENGEGMGTGQVVGIVIGALIGVIVVIAIIILVARRMGQYSP